MKKRLITAVVTALLGLCLSLIGAYNMHLALSRLGGFTFNPLTAMAVFQIPKARAIFLLLYAFVLLAIFWMIAGRSYIKYKSDMYEVTPNIKIPKPEGQGQYGTSWFLDPKKYDQAYAVAAIDEDSELIRDLMAHGYDD